MTTTKNARLWAVLFIAATLTLRPLPLHAQGKPVPADDNKLIAELNDELSDVEAEDELVDEATVEQQIDADLHKSKQIDYAALEKEMEQDHTTIKDLILEAVEQAEAEEHLTFFQAGDKKVNAKSVAKHFVADVDVVHDHVKEQRT